MGWMTKTTATIRSIKYRKIVTKIFQYSMVIMSALIMWKALVCITGTESPVVSVLSGSMEPGFKRGDILFLHMSKDPIRIGEIVVFKLEGKEIPIVHRVIKVHERKDTKEVDVLTKGDNNYGDDTFLYAPGQSWIHRRHIIGRAAGILPYVGWISIFMTEKPYIKKILIGALLFLELEGMTLFLSYASKGFMKIKGLHLKMSFAGLKNRCCGRGK
ncbi:signal peptidase I [Ranunculus cassubicifolius]